jgi:hypothetical protein
MQQVASIQQAWCSNQGRHQHQHQQQQRQGKLD